MTINKRRNHSKLDPPLRPFVNCQICHQINQFCAASFAGPIRDALNSFASSDMTLQMDNSALLKNPLWYYIRHNKRPFFWGMFFLLLTNALDAAYPLFIKAGIDLLTEGGTQSQLLNICLVFFALMASLAATRFLWRVFFGHYHTAAAEDLRNKIFKHYLKMGSGFYQKNPVGELMSLIINDVQSFRTAIGSGVLILVDGITIMLMVLPLMWMLEPSWTWKTLILLPIIPFLIWYTMKLIYKNFKSLQSRLSELSGFSQETVAGIRVIKSFSLEKFRMSEYNKISKNYEKAGNRVALVDSLFFPIMQFGAASGTVILLFVAAPDIFSGSETIGTLVAFQRYISKMVWPMTALGLGVSQYQKGMASFARIAETLSQKSEIVDSGTQSISKIQKLKMSQITYTHPGSSDPTLKNIYLELNEGQKIALVGRVGSGKTTLVNLLCQLLPVQLGQYQINDTPIQEIQKESFYNTIAVVPQEAFLFSDSVIDNIGYGCESLSLQEAQRWTHVVDIHKEVQDLPMGYDSQLGERGVNLSGGQKQRLALARGLATNKSLLILDDTLSAVDHNTEQKILDRLKELRSKKQSQIVISHRLSAIQDCDNIYVLDQGEIVATGTHQELIEKSEIYREMARMQGYLL